MGERTRQDTWPVEAAFSPEPNHKSDFLISLGRTESDHKSIAWRKRVDFSLEVSIAVSPDRPAK
jgi:uncharacterized membrane protein